MYIDLDSSLLDDSLVKSFLEIKYLLEQSHNTVLLHLTVLAPSFVAGTLFFEVFLY